MAYSAFVPTYPFPTYTLVTLLAPLSRIDRHDKDDEKEECTKTWEKYVVQPGDTLADVMADMKGDVEDFVDKNGLSNIYMLPGVAYYICK